MPSKELSMLELEANKTYSFKPTVTPQPVRILVFLLSKEVHKPQAKRLEEALSMPNASFKSLRIRDIRIES